jgi:hypothetical protein
MILIIAAVVVGTLLLLLYLRKRVNKGGSGSGGGGGTPRGAMMRGSGGVVVTGRGTRAYADAADVEHGDRDWEVTTMTLNNTFVPGGAAFAPPAAQHKLAAPRRKVIAYGSADDEVSPLDDCLKGRWVHGEDVSRRQDLVRLLEIGATGVGDFAVLQNPPGSELWGVIVVAFEVEGGVKTRKTEVERRAELGRYVLRPSRLTRGEPLYIQAETFGEVLARISAGGADAHLVDIPLRRGVDVLTRQRMSLADSREAEMANAAAMHRSDEDPATHTLRAGMRGTARLVFQKCWIDHDIAEQLLGARGTRGCFVVWQKPQHRSHLVLSMLKGGAHEFSFAHFDIRRRTDEVILHLGPSSKGGHDEQLKCHSIEELIVALASPDLPSQVPCRLSEGLLNTTRLDDPVERGSLAGLDWFTLASPANDTANLRETTL